MDAVNAEKILKDTALNGNSVVSDVFVRNNRPVVVNVKTADGEASTKDGAPANDATVAAVKAGVAKSVGADVASGGLASAKVLMPPTSHALRPAGVC